MPDLRLLLGRLARIALGVGLLVSAAALALVVIPDTLAPSPGDREVYQEEITYWNPEDGWHQAVRTRTVSLAEDPTGLRVVERIDGPHSPRGDRFSFRTDERLQILREPGVRTGFPPTPHLQDPPKAMALAVPWARAGEAFAGAIDRLELVGQEVVHGLETHVYRANHTGQFYDEAGGPLWFRAVERTVWVEPVTGHTVAYETHETLWQRTERVAIRVPGLAEQLEGRELVWEATVTTTDETVAQRAAAAQSARDDYNLRLGVAGAPPIVLGELAIWRGLRERDD